MKTVGIIAEFNPFHNGHKYLIEESKKITGADYCVVVMSGDFVQRGAPAITDKFTRARSALNSGADLVLELPSYYSLGSAEYFAAGAVSLLNKLNVVDFLAFGSEFEDLDLLLEIADILNEETDLFKRDIKENTKNGKRFASARENAVISEFVRKNPKGEKSSKEAEIKKALTSPNSILAIEYLRALGRTHSKISPVMIIRIGEGYHSNNITSYSSATAIRNSVIQSTGGITELPDSVKCTMPEDSFNSLNEKLRIGEYVREDILNNLLYYKLLQNKDNYCAFLDVTESLSNKITKNLDKFESFDSFCDTLKSKDLSYTRISRCLMHILLDIKAENMQRYKEDDFTSFIRILGQKKSSFPLLAMIGDNSDIPVLNRLKDAEKTLDPLSLQLFKENLDASRIYNLLCNAKKVSEFSLNPLII
ncbi:MAG: nucleotidyltransferase family protein [Butyrivibrio sp.]|nr:nucleotidyltransferase family protein [Butyrivibrio sp.]